MYIIYMYLYNVYMYVDLYDIYVHNLQCNSLYMFYLIINSITSDL